jgi:hypothetical protein
MWKVKMRGHKVGLTEPTIRTDPCVDTVFLEKQVKKIRRSSQ